MSPSVRVFVAIELPAVATDMLAGVVGDLERAQIPGLRPARPEGIHLTLKFLGNVPEVDIKPLVAGLSQALAGSRPFRLRLSGAGAFPNSGRPRVLWVGFEGDLPALSEVQGKIEDALEGLGYARERREFSPHLTVARIGDRASVADRRRAAEALLSAPIGPSAEFAVEGVSLMRSILRPEGARYLRLAIVPLDSDAPHMAV